MGIKVMVKVYRYVGGALFTGVSAWSGQYTYSRKKSTKTRGFFAMSAEMVRETFTEGFRRSSEYLKKTGKAINKTSLLDSQKPNIPDAFKHGREQLVDKLKDRVHANPSHHVHPHAPSHTHHGN
eukprot:TRINITY_DN9496_c0_g1_i3.p1 TRINITY_DN9496_c0_g1~~TRINITY_DN9496_c0_g1_i3.p1  ORF type:complete len:124 (-),score=15.96 TRINITY_DN9496_c0_g1_i3:102-473(-)